MVTSQDVNRTEQQATEAIEAVKRANKVAYCYVSGYLQDPNGYVDAAMLKQALSDCEAALAEADRLITEYNETLISWNKLDVKLRK